MAGFVRYSMRLRTGFELHDYSLKNVRFKRKT